MILEHARRRSRVAATSAVAALITLLGAPAAPAPASYRDAVLTDDPTSYWRLGDAAGTVAADEVGASPGAYAGGVTLGAPGALNGDLDTAAGFDGADDQVELAGSSLVLTATGTIEGWFFWESGVAVMRDHTSSGGWILAFDSGGQVAYRVGGSQFATGVPTASVRDGWHHVALAVAAGSTRWYLDGSLVHTGSVAAPTAAVLPWHVMRNGTFATQGARGRSDELAIYPTALGPEAIARHVAEGRGPTDTVAPAPPQSLTATGALERVALDWADGSEQDLDGYDVYRASSPDGPYTRVNPSRLTGSSFVDGGLTGGATFSYVVRAIDTSGNVSEASEVVTATTETREAVLARYSPFMRYESQETYFADSAAEITDNYVAGRRSNFLRTSGGTILAAADPRDSRADLSLAFLGDPAYADGRPATQTDYLDEANSYRQQDVERLRSSGYADRVYGRVAQSQGRTWLQYWFFYYYDPQSVFGIGAHEGDWEYVQFGLDPAGRPEQATYGQHGDGEACEWGSVERVEGVPVVYPARSSHASYYAPGVAPRGSAPDDYHYGRGYQVRPRLEVVGDTTPSWIAWRGRWGGTSSSPPAPRRQTMWVDPARFHAEAVACTAPARSAQTGRRARPLRTGVPAPAIQVDRRSGAAVRIRYRFARLPQASRRRPIRLLMTATAAGREDVVSAAVEVVRRRTGERSLRLPGRSRRYDVRVTAFSRTGAESAAATASTAGRR